MAVGDVINDVANVNAGANLDFQPASGVEVVLISAGGVNDAAVKVTLYDGTNEGLVCGLDQAYAQAGVIKLGLTNTNYLRIANDSVDPRVCNYSGIQTK